MNIHPNYDSSHLSPASALEQRCTTMQYGIIEYSHIDSCGVQSGCTKKMDELSDDVNYLKSLLRVHPRRHLQRIVRCIIESPGSADRHAQSRSPLQDRHHPVPGAFLHRLRHHPVRVPAIHKERFPVDHEILPRHGHEMVVMLNVYRYCLHGACQRSHVK